MEMKLCTYPSLSKRKQSTGGARNFIAIEAGTRQQLVNEHVIPRNVLAAEDE